MTRVVEAIRNRIEAEREQLELEGMVAVLGNEQAQEAAETENLAEFVLDAHEAMGWCSR